MNNSVLQLFVYLIVCLLKKCMYFCRLKKRKIKLLFNLILFYQQMKENKKFYIAPMVEMMNVRVEKGFEATGETELLEEQGDATGSFRFS